MFRGIVGVDEDVVEVDDDVDVEKVAKDVLHETLESSGGVAEAERHDHHLEESVAGPESGLPFVTLGDTHQVISGTKVDFAIDAGLPRSIEEVGDTREGVLVLSSDFVQTAEVVTKT